MSFVKIKLLINIGLCLITLSLASACSQQPDSSDSKYRDIGWEDLQPEDEIQFESSDDDGLESLEVVEDWFSSDKYADMPGLTSSYYGAPPQAYSGGVVPEIGEQNVRIPGFIVPLEFDEGNFVTEFFLVPYFGACFHKPPPPPNQTIYVKSSVPVKYQSIYDPVWVLGMINIEEKSNEIAMSAYSMDLHSLEPFFQD